MEIRELTALEIGNLIREGALSSPEVTRLFLEAAKADMAAAGQSGDGGQNGDGGHGSRPPEGVGAYISLNEDGALAAAEAVQKRIDAGEILSPLAGVPVAIKDNICVKGGITTAASRMLANFAPPYDATVVEKLRDAGAVMLGKTNLDEFAMGGSTETSLFGVTRNPWDGNRVSGGSSGGSAAVVAAGLAPYAIGSDTGGSIRQPCAFCNVTGLKPTYGSVSRYGLLAYASSLDQIGPIGANARDCAVALSILSGPDDRDSTSIVDAAIDVCGVMGSEAAAGSLKGFKVGIPTNYFEKGLAPDVRDAVLKAAEELRALGAETEEFELPLIEYAVPAYYIIACAEASSNLSRYDGVKYGFRSEKATDILEIYYKSRSEGFGTEVKRRIMLGSFVLSSGYFDAYYKKALQVRGLIKADFDKAFAHYDFILSPVSPTVAYEVGGQIADPLAMYLADVYTVSVNLAGVPAVALPCGTGEGGMPVGMQFIGKAFSEARLLLAADAYQTVTDHHRRKRIPAVLPGTKKGDIPAKA
jgi:aspartyl-tRNA(Asn)/glutamyl-tRNA(Gln) amidotransferase subunit A